MSIAQLVQQRLRIFRISVIEAFCEPVIDFSQHHTRLIAAIGVAEESREAGRCAQLEGLRLHLLGKRDGLAEVAFGQFGLTKFEP
jgi:hypothetical protein